MPTDTESPCPEKTTGCAPRPNVFLYSHTHWDREWYLSQNQFQYRLIWTIDEIIDILKADNGFETFVLDGQTSILTDYLELRPERQEEIQALVAAGKLVIGPWFTMPDLFLPSGEALIRNLQRGWQDCVAFGASYPNTGYVPDSFGHIEQMPQLLRGVGIDNYIFSRGRPVALNTDPDGGREFIWQAPDGSRVQALPFSGAYTDGMFLPRADEPEALRQRIESALQINQSSHCPDIVVLPHGVDHAWLQRDIGDILAALPAACPGVDIHHGTLQEGVEAWKQALPDTQSVYCGQLRGRLQSYELHGTLSSRIDNKLMNETAQMHLENLAEPLQAIAGLLGRPAMPWFFRKAWQLLFHNHAHDSICGCSQDRVHADVNRRFREVIELGIDLADSALDYLNNPARRDHIPTLVVYAGLQGGGRVVDFVIRLPARPHEACCLVEADGTRRALQWLQLTPLRVQQTNGEMSYWECRGCVQLPDLQPCEVRKLVFRAEADPTPVADPVRCTTGGRVLENSRLKVRIHDDGTLDLVDPASGATFRNTHFFVQDGDIGGGYSFEPVPGDRRRDTREERASIRVLCEGPLRAQIAVETRLRVPARYDRGRARRTGRRTIPIRTVFTLDADSPLLQCQTRIDNTAMHQRIRLALPSGLDTDTVHADAGFAVHENHAGKWPADAGKNFHPMRHFVSLCQKHVGMAFLARGLHEYEIVPGATGTRLEVTLLRSVDFVHQCCTWETPEAQLLQPLDYDYALTVLRQDWQESAVPSLAASYRNPAIAAMHGDFAYSKEQEAHATIGYYTRIGQREIPVDANRSTWKRYHAERSGWRRVEPDRYVQGALPDRVIPFRIRGESIVVSAFKARDEGPGRILRFWSYAAEDQTVAVQGDAPTARITRCNLLEQPLPGEAPATGTMELCIRPFEIVTVCIGG